MKTITVGDSLTIELWSSEIVRPPLLRIVSSGGGNIYVRLDEVSGLVSALIEAAAELALLEVENEHNA